MSNSLGEPWSNSSYAPRIPYSIYLEEKTAFAGAMIGAIFYGIVVVLFFQCMAALLVPVRRADGGTKWALVAHTVAMFSFVTIYTTTELIIQSASYIDNREFPGVEGVLPPGPVGYQYLTYFEAANVIRNLMFILNNWLADALLLYRCYIIYSMNRWVIAFPSLVYLASLVTGITYLYHSSRPGNPTTVFVAINHFGIPHHSISVSLNVLLTTMIVARLVLHSRNVREAMGASTTGLYNTIIAMVVESCALFAISFLVFVGLWAAGSPVASVFFSVLVETQVIAPFLVIRRVTRRNASTSSTIVPGKTSSIRFQHHRKSTGGNCALPCGCQTSSAETYGETPRDLEVAITIDLQHDK